LTAREKKPRLQKEKKDYRPGEESSVFLGREENRNRERKSEKGERLSRGREPCTVLARGENEKSRCRQTVKKKSSEKKLAARRKKLKDQKNSYSPSKGGKRSDEGEKRALTKEKE